VQLRDAWNAATRRLIPVTGPVNRALGRFDNTVWVIGDGRSGSSWFADLLAGTLGYRQLYEPFHPYMVEEFHGFALNHFQPRGLKNERLRTALEQVFEGRINHRRVNSRAAGLLFNGLVAKDVFASLFAAWAVQNFPAVKPVLLMRNPFAVALSKTQHGNYAWNNGPAELLQQSELVQRHLRDDVGFLREVEARGDPLLNHLAVWAILHAVLFRQFAPEKLHIATYENVLRDPAAEIQATIAFLGKDAGGVSVPAELLGRTALHSEASSVRAARESQGSGWKSRVTDEQIEAGKQILARFGIGGLYVDVEPSPDLPTIAARLWRSPSQSKP
jgi:hypothetical protein